MIILGIETSCDETALALYDTSKGASERLVAELISSQVTMHSEYGGVVPELAAREHLKNLPLLFDRLLAEAAVSAEQLDQIAVTAGPGLKGCLLMGLGFAQGLGQALQKPVVAINHIEAHLYSAFVTGKKIEYPFLALIVSGGHTEIVKVTGLAQYQVLVRTLDDAAGEAFDKAANLLGLSYPGGPNLAALADTVTSSEFKLPQVMREAEGFSFSGLKTAIMLLIERQKKLSNYQAQQASLAFTIQHAIVQALMFKLKQQIELTGIKRVVLSGGVSANRALQKHLTARHDLEVHWPQPKHYTDNAAMIVFLAALKAEQGIFETDLAVKPRWWLESISLESGV